MNRKTVQEMRDYLKTVFTGKLNNKNNGHKTTGRMRRESCYDDPYYVRDMKLYSLPRKYYGTAYRLFMDGGDAHYWLITPVLEEFEKRWGVKVGFIGHCYGNLQLTVDINPDNLEDEEVETVYNTLKAFDDLADDIFNAVIAECVSINQTLAANIAEYCASQYSLFDAVDETRKGWDIGEGHIKAIEEYGEKFEDGGDALTLNAVKHLRDALKLTDDDALYEILEFECDFSTGDIEHVKAA